MKLETLEDMNTDNYVSKKRLRSEAIKRIRLIRAKRRNKQWLHDIERNAEDVLIDICNLTEEDITAI